MSTRKERAAERLTHLTTESDKDEIKAVRSRHRKFAFMAKAQDAGVTYRELSEITGLSEIRVAQILRSERSKVAVADKAKSNGQVLRKAKKRSAR